MRRPNLRFLAVFCGSLLAVAVVAHFVHGYQAKRTAGILLHKARELREADNLSPAIGYYSRYLQLNPGDTAALGEYGLALATAQPSSVETLMVLEQIVRRDPQHLATRKTLVEVAMRLGRYSDAATHLEVLLQSNPTSDELYLMRGECRSANRDFSAAQQDYRKAIELLPQNAIVYLSLATLLRDNLKQPAEADQVMRLLVEQNSTSAEARLLSARYWQYYGQPEQALADAEAALKISPDNAEAALLAATVSLAVEDLQRAFTYIAQAKKLDSKNAATHLVAAQVALAMDGVDAAVQSLRDGLTEAPASVDLRWQLVNLLISRGDFEEVQSICDALTDLPQGQPVASYLQSRVLMQNGDVMAAHAKLEALRSEPIERNDLRQQIEFWLGVCADRIDNVDQRIAAYRRAVEINPNWEPAQIGLAAALTAAGRVDEALTTYDTLMSAPRVRASTFLEVCRLLILQQLQLPQGQRNWTNVQELWKQAAKQSPGSPGLAVLLAEIFIGKRQPERALEALESSCVKNPEASELWLARAVLLTNQRRYTDATAVLDEAKSKFGLSGLIVAQQIRLALSENSEAETHLDQLCRGWEGFSADERFGLHRLAASAFSTIGNSAKADLHWVEATRLRPEWLPGYLSQFSTAASAGDSRRIDALLEQIRKLESADQGPLWCYGEAARLLLLSDDEPANVDRARKLLAETIAQRPRWPEPRALMAEIERLEGNLNVATDHYRAAMELGDNSQRLVRELVVLLIQRRKFAEADQVLRRLESREFVLSSDLSRMGSELSWQAQDYGRAVRLAQQAVTESQTVENLLWLARLWDHEKTFEESEAIYRQAVLLHPTDSRVWLGFARHWIERAEPLRSEQTIQEAKPHLDATAAVLVQAEIYDALTRPDEAGARYRELLQIAGDDPASALQAIGFLIRQGQFAEAETALRRLLTPEIMCTDAERAEVRRRLALVLGQTGEYAKLQEAKELISAEATTRQPVLLEDLRIKGIILSGMPDHDSRNTGVAILKQVVSDAASTENDRFMLAQICSRQGDWPQARALLRSLVTLPNPQPQYVASYVNGLLVQGEVAEAEAWIPKLVSLDVEGNFAPVLQARIEVAAGRVEAALAALEQAPQTPNGAPSPGRLGEIIDQLASQATVESDSKELRDAAEKYFRKSLEVEPAMRGRALLFLARQGYVSECLNRCAAWAGQSNGPEAVLVALSVVRQPAATQADRSRAEGMAREALASDPDSTVLLTALASYLEFDHRLDEAIRVYRRAVELEPDGAVASNNLAVLLAHRGEVPEALMLIEKIIARHGPLPVFLDSRGSIHLAGGKTESALEDFEKVVAAEPSAIRLFHCALAQYRANRLAEAQKSFRTAVERGLQPEQLHAAEKSDFLRLSKQFSS